MQGAQVFQPTHRFGNETYLFTVGFDKRNTVTLAFESRAVILPAVTLTLVFAGWQWQVRRNLDGRLQACPTA